MSSSTATRILDAALKAAQAGDLTVAEVAAQAGLSRQAVYLHFPDRAALLAALAGRLAPDTNALVEAIVQAPSARSGLAAMVDWQIEHYPRLAPVARLSGEEEGGNRLAPCRAVAQRFQAEGRLAPHLGLDAACDLLWSLTGPQVWEALSAGRGWLPSRVRDHLIFLSVSVLTK